MYLCGPCYCDAYVKYSALCVGVNTLHQGCATSGPRAKCNTTKCIFMLVTSTRQPMWNEGAVRGLICLIVFGPSVIKVAHPCLTQYTMSTGSLIPILVIFTSKMQVSTFWYIVPLWNYFCHYFVPFLITDMKQNKRNSKNKSRQIPSYLKH